MILFAVCLIAALARHGVSADIGQLRNSFAHPPDNARILMRWWWFGPAVQDQEMDRELQVMKAAGIGGVEIQPVYPVRLDDAQLRNLPYLSPEFLHALRHASETARSLGLRVDITLGSGWPYGGPHTPIAEAAGRLRVEQVTVPEGTRSVPVPAMEGGETLIAAFIGGRQANDFEGGRVLIPAGLSGSDLLSFFISSRTGQQVKRTAVGAEGFVLDHYNRAAIDSHLSFVGKQLLEAFGDHPPYAVFSDSLEVYGSDWTLNFLAEFKQRRGYDLTPFLPSLVDDGGANTRAIRHDWAKTLTELTEDNYLKPIREWAQKQGTLFRSQTYGEPPVILSSNQFVDLPEGEHGPYWRRFSAARWASSASHLYGRPITSTETWTWLHSPAFRATPLDLKAEADRHFLQGINQLIGHGWPYSPPSEAEPGWFFYAAAALNEHNPWFDVMPDLAAYLQRISFLMRQGKPANDVAIYVPTDDAWARLHPGKVAVDEMSDTLLGPVLIPAVLNAGYNFDFIDDRAIKAVGIPYQAIILPGVERIPLGTMQQLQTYISSGGNVLATRSLPRLGAGVLEEKSESARIRELAAHMFEEKNRHARFVEADADVAQALRELVQPDFEVEPDAAPAVGFVHRKLPQADIYFIANSTNRAVHTSASIRVQGMFPEWWDPFAGQSSPAGYQVRNGRAVVPLHLEPYQSAVLVWMPKGFSVPAPVKADTEFHGLTLDLSSNWTVTFQSTGQHVSLPHLRSWTEDESTRWYSGRATYEKSIDIPDAFLAGATRVLLDFGPGVAVEPNLQETPGMHALLESPVREAGVVTVNGQRAGTVWHPPYQLDLRPFLHRGTNQLQITVANLAINQMAGRAAPNNTLLNLRYGERFVPQDMNALTALPSGILHSVWLRKEQ